MSSAAKKLELLQFFKSVKTNHVTQYWRQTPPPLTPTQLTKRDNMQVILLKVKMYKNREEMCGLLVNLP